MTRQAQNTTDNIADGSAPKLESRPLSMQEKLLWIRDLIIQYEDGMFTIEETYRQAKEILEMPDVEEGES